jgi:ATP phosphoribosyltransferase
VPRAKLDAVLALMPDRKPTISTLSDPEWVDVLVILGEEVVRRIIPPLKRAGATGIVEFPLSKIIE